MKYKIAILLFLVMFALGGKEVFAYEDITITGSYKDDPPNYNYITYTPEQDWNGNTRRSVVCNAGTTFTDNFDTNTQCETTVSLNITCYATLISCGVIYDDTPSGNYIMGVFADQELTTLEFVSNIFSWNGTEVGTADLTTHIVELLPANNTIATSTGTTTDITISLNAYINPDDLGTFSGVKIELENIDQNTILSSLTSFFGVGNTQTLFFGNATTSGPFSYSEVVSLPNGNYRVHAVMTRSYLSIFNGFKTFDEQSSQFIVGSSTWLGNIRQDTFEQADQFYGTLSATSSSAMAKSCSPFSSDFGIRECLGFLFIPDTQQLEDTLESFREGVLVRIPWGYVTRTYDIFNSTTTVALPAISFTFGQGPLDGETWNINTDEMVASAGTLLEEVEDRNGNTIRDVTEPLIKLFIAIAVLFTIIMDTMKSHDHHGVGVNTSKTR